MRRAVPAFITLTILACAIGLAAESPIKIDGLTVDGWQKTDGPQTWIGDAVEEKIDGFVDFHKGSTVSGCCWGKTTRSSMSSSSPTTRPKTLSVCTR